MAEPLYDVILGNIKGAALPDTLRSNASAPEYDHAHVKTEQCTDSGKGNFISRTQKVPGDLAAFQASSKGKKSSEFLHGNALEDSPEPDKELEKAKKPQKGYYGKKARPCGVFLRWTCERPGQATDGVPDGVSETS
ncbi:hypothetical protein HPB52_021610 [Rhipicephalus sanguineus]|uniref:Uncharacterized protein n=1 Tax=Rhipicephalus sanguineus TaxID=34632 RepID=A0A9D4T693_RHISA|nr:hypothetical protein HPB52_021610 [Rhipicephalus sanguineus]